MPRTVTVNSVPPVTDEALRRRPIPVALGMSILHFLAALVILVVGLGVFGLIFLSQRAETIRSHWMSSPDLSFEE